MPLAETTLTFSNRLDEIARMQEAVEELGPALGLPPQTVFAITLSLEEVLTNIITYGYERAGEHTIRVRFRRDGGPVVIEVEDDGRPFNPLDRDPPDTTASVDEREVGGLGIHLVKNMMDEVSYARVGDRNVLTLKKQLQE